jgi:hypothetical protein
MQQQLCFNQNHLDLLEDERKEAGGAHVVASENLSSARRELTENTLYLKSLKGAREPSPHHISRQQSIVDNATHKVERLTTAQDRLSPRNIATNTALRAVRDYISQSRLKPSATNFDANYPVPQVAPDQVHKAVAKTRAEIENLKARRVTVEKHHVSRDVAEERIAAAFTRASDILGPMNTSWLFSPKRYGGDVLKLVNCGTINGEPVTVHELSPRLLLTFIEEGARALYARQVSQFYDKSGPGISDQDRSSQLLQLDKQLMAAEQREEALIRLAAQNSVVIDRRIDADPAAILGPIFQEEVPDQEPVLRSTPRLIPQNQRVVALQGDRRGVLTETDHLPGKIEAI